MPCYPPSPPRRSLVLSQIRDLNADRRCWNQVGDVLVETQAGQVVPKLESTRAQVRRCEIRAKETANADK